MTDQFPYLITYSDSATALLTLNKMTRTLTKSEGGEPMLTTISIPSDMLLGDVDRAIVSDLNLGLSAVDAFDSIARKVSA